MFHALYQIQNLSILVLILLRYVIYYVLWLGLVSPIYLDFNFSFHVLFFLIFSYVDNLTLHYSSEFVMGSLFTFSWLHFGYCSLMECLLNYSLQSNPLSLPELHNFPEQPPLASWANHSIQRDKRSSERMLFEGTSLSNKKRHIKDSTTSEKSNQNEKLKQPTILDAFKRAGVVVSQDVNDSSSGHPSNGISQSIKHQDDSNEDGFIEITAELRLLDAQRFKFRPLLVDCLSILSFSEVRICLDLILALLILSLLHYLKLSCD